MNVNKTFFNIYLIFNLYCINFSWRGIMLACSAFIDNPWNFQFRGFRVNDSPE